MLMASFLSEEWTSKLIEHKIWNFENSHLMQFSVKSHYIILLSLILHQKFRTFSISSHTAWEATPRVWKRRESEKVQFWDQWQKWKKIRKLFLMLDFFPSIFQNRGKHLILREVGMFKSKYFDSDLFTKKNKYFDSDLFTKKINK